MRISDIFIIVCFSVCPSSAKNSGSIYKAVRCLSGMSATSKDISASLSDCAIFSNYHNRKAFSFQNTTNICKGYTEDANGGTVCLSAGGERYYEIPSDCPLPPVPSNYTLEQPYNGNKELARYRCKVLTDQPPVDHCPVVKCGSQPDMSTPPASCSVKDRFSSSQFEGRVTCTVQGITCQRWDANFPQTVYVFTGRSDLGNRCQIQGAVRPWCYTIDPGVRWDYCPYAELNCGDPPAVQLPPTMTGARIEVEWPYQQSYELAWYRCASYVPTDPVANCPVATCNGDLAWYNATVSCSVKDCYDATSLTYHGRVSCTAGGITCQRWDTNVPHWHPEFSGRSDLQNWCQMTSTSENRPWCYTTNPNLEWGYCAVEKCL